MRRLLVVSVILAAFGACAQLVRPAKPLPAGCSTVVYGACVVFESRLVVSDADLRVAFEHAARVWKTKPTQLAGWVVVFHGTSPLSWTPLGGAFWGITVPDVRRIDVTFYKPTCPALVLAHEWGHTVVGGGHEDPRYEDSFLLKALADVEGCSP